MTKILILLLSAGVGYAMGWYCGKKGFSKKKTICIMALIIALVEWPLMALYSLAS